MPAIRIPKIARKCFFASAIVKVIPRRVVMAETPKPQQQQVQIKADEKELLGQYANLVVVHHNAEEFTLNFIYLFPSVPHGKLVGSLILSPAHAKRLAKALAGKCVSFRRAVWNASGRSRPRSGTQRRICAVITRRTYFLLPSRPWIPGIRPRQQSRLPGPTDSTPRALRT